MNIARTMSLIAICFNTASRINVPRACCIGCCYTAEKKQLCLREQLTNDHDPFMKQCALCLCCLALEGSIKAATIYSQFCV